MDVKVNYLQDGQLGTVTVPGDDYETTRGKARELVPEGALIISYVVDRG